MKKVVLLVALLAVGAVVAAELAAPGWIAREAEQHVAAESRGALAVEVTVSGPPVIIPLLATGTVSSWDMRLEQVAGRAVPIEVTVGLRDVALDRGSLLRGDVVVQEVGHATALVRANLDGIVPEGLRPLVERLGQLGGGMIEQLGGEDLLWEMAEGFGVVRQGDTVTVEGELALPIVAGSCSLSMVDLVVTATCELAEVPDVLLRAFR